MEILASVARGHLSQHSDVARVPGPITANAWPNDNVPRPKAMKVGRDARGPAACGGEMLRR